MTDAISQVSWTSVVAAVVAVTMLGALWYMALFPRVYARSLGREHDPAQKPGPLFIVGPMVCSLVVTLTSAILLHALGVTTLGGAFGFGALVGLGYLASMTMNIAINPLFPHPFRYTLVSGSYFFVSSVVTSVILVLLH